MPTVRILSTKVARVFAQTIGSLAAEVDVLVERNDPASLARAAKLLGEIERRKDALTIDVAGRLERLWEDGATRPAVRALGERSVPAILQAYAGIEPSRAIDYARVGEALRPRATLLGEPLPPRHSSIAAALDDGRLRVAQASRIIDTLEQIEPYSSLADREGAEAFLVAEAPLLSDRGFTVACAELAGKFVPERLEERDAMLRRRAGVEFRSTRDGRRQAVIDLHPELEGFFKAALDAKTAPRRRPTFLPEGEDVELDRRPLRVKRGDALEVILRRSLGDDDGRVAGTSVTMHVTVALADLRSGLGSAKIAGVDEKIPASVARRLAADAEIIPVVLGGPSEPLDVGRSERLATTAQRSALGLRDGGCIWPGCDMPPGWCEVAHVVAWADGGPTDLSNLVLLCPFHHSCFDNDRWELATIDGERHLIPPAWVDSVRTPRRAGKSLAFAA